MFLSPAVVGLLATPLGKLLLALVVIAVVILLGRFVMNVAWKLVIIVTIAVAALLVVTNLPY